MTVCIAQTANSARALDKTHTTNHTSTHQTSQLQHETRGTQQTTPRPQTQRHRSTRGEREGILPQHPTVQPYHSRT